MNEQPPRRGYNFPIARMVVRIARKWKTRHRNALNFGLHLVGIPLVLIGIVLLFFLPWYWGVGGFVLGYFLQWLGHQIEGNDVGELIPIKRALGLPAVAISPRYARPGDPPTLTQPATSSPDDQRAAS